MAVYRLDPLEDPRWAEFVLTHPRACSFHTPGWLRALKECYGYEPLVLTTTPPQQPLKNGIAVCRLNSWLTGTRHVSLPFSDHCEPLIDDAETASELFSSMAGEASGRSIRSVQLRPLSDSFADVVGSVGFGEAEAYSFHVLDLRPPLQEILGTFHASSVRRSLRRSEREGLMYEEGHSEELLQKFYRLQLLTRRRHGLPPQPMSWFRSIVRNLPDEATIRVASKDGQAIASILTLRHNGWVIYKYGCSDVRFNKLGAINFLFWKTIEQAKANGDTAFDLGRSDLDNQGLIEFKSHWGTKATRLTYYRHPAPVEVDKGHSVAWVRSAAKRLIAHAPDAVLVGLSKILYRHVG